MGREQWTYDTYNNLTERQQDGQAWSYKYDGRSRLTAVLSAQQLVAEYGYDPFGRRLWKKTADGIAQFTWDGERLAAEITPDGTSEYIFEPLTHVPLARVYRGSVQAFHTDHLGTPFLVTDEQGERVWEGEVSLTAGVVPAVSSYQSQPLRFPGHYYDPETGLHYNRHRYYDPRSGSYITPDPIGFSGSLNLFQYVPHPLSWIDPYGLQAQRPYNQDEVSDILDASDGRPSPTSGQAGHPRSDHVGLSNTELQARADGTGRPATTFESGAAQNRATTNALNSPQGQTALGQIDAGSPRERIRVQVGPETAREARSGRGYITRTNGAREVTVIVDRLPSGEIHIQTCYMRI